MNEESKAVYRSYLKHSAKGQSWGKHKYIAIKNGRYIYPEDLKGDQHNQFNRISSIDKDKKVIEARRKWLGEGGNTQARGGTLNVRSNSSAGRANEKADLRYSVSKTPHEGSKARANAEYEKAIKEAGRDRQAYIKARQEAANKVNAPLRARQINDQIKSAHSNATSSKMDLTPGSELKKKAEERKAANTNSTAKTKEQEIAEQIKKNNSGTIPEKKEEPKKEETKTTTATTTEETTEEKKSGSGKGGGKKGSGSKSKSSKKETDAKTEQTNTPASASEEAKALGLSEDDINLLDSNIDVTATDRDTVIRNLALRVIKGDFGNGEDRRAKLGKYYAEIQKKVNELMKELKSSKSTQMKQTASYGFDILRELGGAIGVLAHSGVKFRSGRYKYGSGDRPHQHDGRGGSARDLSDDDLKKAIARKGLERQYNKMYKRDRLGDVKEVVDATSSAVNRVNNKNREKLNRRPQRERMNLEGMTDKELRDRINRELLEKQYSDLFGKEKNTVSDGERKAAEILDITGDVLGVTSSALLIALSIKKLMGK